MPLRVDKGKHMKDLVNIRKSRKLTQQEVADLANVSRQAYSSYETGIRRPSPEVAIRLGAALDFDWTRFYETEKEN